MDRDRDRRDDRDRQFYRPARSPPPRDSYRGGRSPPRRPLPTADTYVPGNRPTRPRSRSPGFRRRSRSPPRNDSWRSARLRSPIRRGYSPRRDDYRVNTRGRSPRRDGYEPVYVRSPRREGRDRDRERERSPLKRAREVSPARSRGMRSPPPQAKRERIDSLPMRTRDEEPRSRAASPPRRGYPPSPRENRDSRRRSPSPRREPRADPYTAATWRRRSPSPARQGFPANDASGRGSATTSRRSSPPVHQSRAALIPEEPRRPEPISPAPRSPYRPASDPEPVRRTPPTGPREREFSNGAPPTGPAYRNGDGFSRAPPTGPAPNRPVSRNFGGPAMSPPIGPSSSSTNTPTYPRAHNPALAPPTRPRGGGGRGFGGDYPPREYGGGIPPVRRGSGHWSGGRGGPGPAPYYASNGPPAGPRGGGSIGGAPPFRGSSNSSSTTYPRTQRFHNHLADVPAVVPGGKMAPDLFDRAPASKLAKLEEDARKLREAIEEKQAKKRQNLREWETLEREVNNNTLKADLAEQHLKSLNGENDVGGAAF